MPEHDAESLPPRSERPWLYSLLVAPNAVLANGVVQGGALAFLMSRHGVSSKQTADIIALLSLPTTIYFLWSPITDFFIRRRSWLLFGALFGGLLMALGMQQADLGSRAAVTLMFLGSCLGQLVVSACGGMMGALRSERSKRVSGSFYQGGSLAFGALSVFVLISVVEGRHAGWLSWVAGALIALPGLAALFAPEQETVATGGFGATMARVWQEFRATFLNRRALPYLFTLAMPATSGAAMGLLPGVADHYGVAGAQVAWMNGIGGALLTAAGSMAATLIPQRVRASVAYCLIGIVNAFTLGVLALGPMHPATYFAGVTLYLFTVGIGYAVFTAVLLEFMGASGKSGSARYSITNSLGNVPGVLMIKLDGLGSGRWGVRGLTATEALVGLVVASAMLAVLLVLRPQAAQLPAGE